MLDTIRHFVTRKILQPPDAQPEAHQSGVQLAACALLLELAHADGEFCQEERTRIEDAIHRHFGLDDATTKELMELAEAERAQAVDDFQFTRLIADQYDLGQKMVLAEIMWSVILADGKIAEHETYLLRKVANLLRLEPAYLAQARRAADSST